VCEILCKLQRYCAGTLITLPCVMLLDWQNIMLGVCYYCNWLCVCTFLCTDCHVRKFMISFFDNCVLIYTLSSPTDN
jgi:hypothetical protein